MFPCAICNTILKDKSSFNRHKKAHDTPPWLCVSCHIPLKRKEKARKHLWRFHSIGYSQANELLLDATLDPTTGQKHLITEEPDQRHKRLVKKGWTASRPILTIDDELDAILNVSKLRKRTPIEQTEVPQTQNGPPAQSEQNSPPGSDLQTKSPVDTAEHGLSLSETMGNQLVEATGHAQDNPISPTPFRLEPPPANYHSPSNTENFLFNIRLPDLPIESYTNQEMSTDAATTSSDITASHQPIIPPTSVSQHRFIDHQRESIYTDLFGIETPDSPGDPPNSAKPTPLHQSNSYYSPTGLFLPSPPPVPLDSNRERIQDHIFLQPIHRLTLDPQKMDALDEILLRRDQYEHQFNPRCVGCYVAIEEALENGEDEYLCNYTLEFCRTINRHIRRQ